MILLYTLLLHVNFSNNYKIIINNDDIVHEGVKYENSYIWLNKISIEPIRKIIFYWSSLLQISYSHDWNDNVIYNVCYFKLIKMIAQLYSDISATCCYITSNISLSGLHQVIHRIYRWYRIHLLSQLYMCNEENSFQMKIFINLRGISFHLKGLLPTRCLLYL